MRPSPHRSNAVEAFASQRNGVWFAIPRLNPGSHPFRGLPPTGPLTRFMTTWVPISSALRCTDKVGRGLGLLDGSRESSDPAASRSRVATVRNRLFWLASSSLRARRHARSVSGFPVSHASSAAFADEEREERDGQGHDKLVHHLPPFFEAFICALPSQSSFKHLTMLVNLRPCSLVMYSPGGMMTATGSDPTGPPAVRSMARSPS